MAEQYYSKYDHLSRELNWLNCTGPIWIPSDADSAREKGCYPILYRYFWGIDKPLEFHHIIALIIVLKNQVPSLSFIVPYRINHRSFKF